MTDPTGDETGDGVDGRSVRRDVESCRRSHRALVDHLESLGDRDTTAPSLLPGWTLGHVLTHVARNADGHRSMLAGLPQYPQGASGRNADIEAGAGRAWGEIVADVVVTCRLLDEAFAAHSDWGGRSSLLSGDRPTALLPLLRQREVEVHRADLGLGYDFADMPADYVRGDLRLMEMLWRARRPMGMTPLPDAALALEPPMRLAWLLGRAEVPGLPPAGLL